MSYVIKTRFLAGNLVSQGNLFKYIARAGVEPCDMFYRHRFNLGRDTVDSTEFTNPCDPPLNYLTMHYSSCTPTLVQ